MSSDPQEGPPPDRRSERIDLAQIHPILPQLIDSLSDAVLVVDRSQRIVAANRRYMEAFGREAGRVAGSVCSNVVDCPERSIGVVQERCATCDVLHLRQPTRRLRVVPDASGAQRRWEGTFSPVINAAGEISHVVEVWRDVSERSQLESQLSHSERLAALGVLAAGVAHEINNPLAAILAGVESLERWLGSGTGNLGDAARAQEAVEVLQALEGETRRVREITEKLMLLAQPYSTSPVWVDFNRAAGDTLHLLRYQMLQQSIRSVENLEAGLPHVWASETGMRSICMNLMMNAVQAMPSGGTLTVRTRRHGPARVLLEVGDTGPGIQPHHMDRIWDPFFTTKPTGQGTGLGLSITQRIVTRHGGQIHAANSEGGGALFVVELPIEGAGGAGLG
jgi:two-component system, NtrC family, sensor kinase